MTQQMTREQILASVVPKSDQWNYDDLIGGPVTVTVAGVSAGAADQPVNVRLVNDKKFYRPCKSMRRVLIMLWGDDGHKWVGRSMTLFGDPNVKFGGVAVGGIRISHMSDIDGPERAIFDNDARPESALQGAAAQDDRTAGNSSSVGAGEPAG